VNTLTGRCWVGSFAMPRASMCISMFTYSNLVRAIRYSLSVALNSLSVKFNVGAVSLRSKSFCLIEPSRKNVKKQVCLRNKRAFAV
jgi:hypothetical protein